MVLYSGSLFAVTVATKQPIYCPKPSQLQPLIKLTAAKKDKGIWGVGKAAADSRHEPFIIWRSYGGYSFAKKITRFDHVEWQGVRVGSVICLYEGVDQQGNVVPFKVALQMVHPTVILEPTASQWVIGKYGYKSCTSSEVKDCPFYAAVLNSAPKDIYKALMENRLKQSS